MKYDNTFEKIFNPRTSLVNILQLFDFLPNVFFHIKDVHQKFLWMNTALRQHLGEKEEMGFLNKTDSDYFNPNLVFLYQREDNEVITTCRPILNQPWFVPGLNNEQKWFISSKIPLTDMDGKVVATAGLMRNLSQEYEAANPLNEMKNVIDYIFAHYYEKISLDTLASLVFLSQRQFERRFHELFCLSPRDFILKVRIDKAIRFLVESEDSITQIALNCGFYDNSYFTRQFKKMTAMSPLQFRKKYASNQPSDNSTQEKSLTDKMSEKYKKMSK
ncbi:MAG: AraC family transcriptional regulator [Planctomycetaceae bacterium]|jgi:AraC-like DNA-binding protein|nr:AraC family transcriptional regulator [Planctomycetaceae bacterium]